MPNSPPTAVTYSSTGTSRRTAIEKSQYTQRRAQKGTCTYTWPGNTNEICPSTDSPAANLAREVALDRAAELEAGHRGETFAHRQPGPRAQLVDRGGAASEGGPYAHLAGVVYVRLGARRRRQTGKAERVGDGD